MASSESALAEQPSFLELLCIRADQCGLPLPTEETKLVVVARGDLPITTGKIASQVGHASVEAMTTCFDAKPNVLLKWMMDGQKKVVVKSDNLASMNNIIERAKAAGLCVSAIEDAGRTQIEPGTRTVVGIGPDAESKFVGITDKLRLL